MARDHFRVKQENRRGVHLEIFFFKGGFCQCLTGSGNGEKKGPELGASGFTADVLNVLFRPVPIQAISLIRGDLWG